jgi:hypothetical protein
MMLFTTNGNAYEIYKFDLKSQIISAVGYVGEVEMRYTYAYGDSFAGLVLNEKHEHEWVVADSKDATCTEDGYATYKCICGETYTETIEATGHTEETTPSKDATCTEPGLTEGKHCANCGEILVEQEETPALGHNFVDGKCEHCGEADPNYETPDTGDRIYLAIAAAVLSMMGVVALTAKKREF